MQRRTKIVGAIIKAGVFDGFVDAQHHRVHARAQGGDVRFFDGDVRFGEIGPAGFCAVGVVGAARFGPAFVDGATTVVAEERAWFSQSSAFVDQETGNPGAVSGGAGQHAGEIGGREILLDMFGRKKHFMRLNVHRDTATESAARSAGDGCSHLGGSFGEGPVEFLHAPVERGEHGGGILPGLQPFLHALHGVGEQLVALFFEGGGEHRSSGT